MLKELEKQSTYMSSCSCTVENVVENIFTLQEKYILECISSKNMILSDYLLGNYIFHYIYKMCLVRTLNMSVTMKMTTIALLYYIEFLSQINSARIHEKPFQNLMMKPIFQEESTIDVSMGVLSLVSSKNDGESDEKKEASFPTFTFHNQEQKISITHHDVMMFVYNKTLSNICKNYSKTDVEFERRMVTCDYYFKIMNICLHYLFENRSVSTFQDLLKYHKKFLKVVKNLLRYDLSLNHLQSLLIYIEYLLIHELDIKDVLFYIELFASKLHIDKDAMPWLVPSYVLSRCNHYKYSIFLRSLIPMKFMDWFFHEET